MAITIEMVMSGEQLMGIQFSENGSPSCFIAVNQEGWPGVRSGSFPKPFPSPEFTRKQVMVIRDDRITIGRED